MSHKRARGPAILRAAARGRRVRVGACRTRHPPPTRFPAAAARRPAAPRPERGGDAGAPPLLCVPQPSPPSPAQRGGGSATAVPVARGPRPKPGTIGGGAQSPPCPPPSPPRSPPRRNMAARPPLPPSRAGLPRRVPRPAGDRRGFHAATKAGPGLLRRPRPGKLRAPPGGCPRGLTKPTRSGGGVQAAPPRAPAPSAHPRAHKVWGPAGSGPGHAARRLAGTSWARPLPVRGLPHVPLPPPLCSGGALTLAPERNFPCPGTPRPACARSLGGGGAQASRVPCPRGHCVRRAPARLPRRPAQAGSARVPGAAAARTPPPPALPSAARPCPSASPRASEAAASGRCHTPGRPTARDPPRSPATPRPPRCPRAIPPHPPAALRTRAAHNRFHSLGGGAGRLTRRSSRHHLRLARRGLSLPPPHPPPLYYDRRPQAGGAANRPARPAEGASRGGASRGGTAGVVPTPSASPEGAKWREGAGRAAAAAPRRTMWVNEGRRLPPQRPAHGGSGSAAGKAGAGSRSRRRAAFPRPRSPAARPLPPASPSASPGHLAPRLRHALR
ncbi:unnamed protein product [Rangifer tarandus platyrhynchus]|uniref:Basic proline-rich protein-like n=1 Tax=Rangifer tarandus platyrhynchus TaxID=3082113 RepID=A0ABN8ZXV4_RANTA|nr:unnamed protein product [Rangifer tarandus platyrhynchus]